MALKMNSVPGGSVKKKNTSVYNPNPINVAGGNKSSNSTSFKNNTTQKPVITVPKLGVSNGTNKISKGTGPLYTPGTGNVINNNTQNNGTAGINRDFGSNNFSSGGDSNYSGNGTTVTQPHLPNYYEALINKFEEDNEKARQDALNALEASYKTNKGIYETQLSELGDQYDALRNQSEVERYKTRAAMREALANRGQLDSGYGRQENLIMDTKYGNAINSINMQEAKARQDIQNMISQLLAEKEYNRNTINNEYNEKRQNALNTLRGYLA